MPWTVHCKPAEGAVLLNTTPMTAEDAIDLGRRLKKAGRAVLEHRERQRQAKAAANAQAVTMEPDDPDDDDDHPSEAELGLGDVD